MTLPVPRLTATILPATGDGLRRVVCHEGKNWQARISKARSGRKPCRCTACGQVGHSRANKDCPERLREAKDELKARRR